MRIAWFRPASTASGGTDDLTGVQAGLAAAHRVDVVEQEQAHDFVWRQARAPYDVCVFELDDTAAHDYIWPYLLHYPGVLALRTASLHASRTTSLMHRYRRQAYDAEMAFNQGGRRPLVPWHVARGRWPFVRVPILASRLTAVCDASWAGQLQAEYPQGRVRYAPIGVAGVPASPSADTSGRTPQSAQGARPLRVAIADGVETGAADRAIDRARAGGLTIEHVAMDPRSPGNEGPDALVVLGRTWGRPVAAALRGMAAGVPVIVIESAATAGWPAIDPQSWQPRGFDSTAAPAVVSLDARDEEHSLVLALRRLATDVVFRHTLAASGYAWWAAHHTLEHAVSAWDDLLREAAVAAPLPPPPDWPSHLRDDGTERARQILADFGLALDEALA
jgi:hypothetical protein